MEIEIALVISLISINFALVSIATKLSLIAEKMPRRAR
jgi:hypothetical protein